MSVGQLIRVGLPFSNVVPTGTATNNITPGRTLDTLRLRLGGTTFTKAMISKLKLKANGKVIVEGTGNQLQAINNYRGLAADPAFLDVSFTDYGLNNEFDRKVGAFDTSKGISNITTEVEIAGATAPTLKPILIESAQQNSKGGDALPFAGLIGKVLSYPYNTATGGKLPVTVPFGPTSGSIIKRLHVFHTGNVTGVTVKQDGLVIFEADKAENEYMQKMHGRVPQANVFTIDFCVDGDISKALDTRASKSLEWLLDLSAADVGEILVEYVDPLSNL